MKTLFKGTLYEVPDWSTHIAVDKPTGDVYAYEKAPEEATDGTWLCLYGEMKSLGNINCSEIVEYIK